ncbi:hypothetical protein [Paraflavitalea speifideaquila]|uniref:hypothetical protein n=1 Tax=Paraflavitalea speifideaquila TaxID=3076558 RepID=UPI0028E2062D|nr:hypothetical protein [Paraflavitalea speifideiaquila]
MQGQLTNLLAALDSQGYSDNMVDEHLVYLLRHLVRTQHAASIRVANVQAIKAATRTEIYRRVAIARDILHSTYMENPDLKAISTIACLSVPQLVRQFKSVFQTTPINTSPRLNCKGLPTY